MVKKMLLKWVGIALVATVLVLCALRWRRARKHVVHLSAQSVASRWARFWAMAKRLAKSSSRPIRFFIDGIDIQDKPVPDRNAFEALVRKAAAWGLRRTGATVDPFNVRWESGPTMWYADGTIVVNPGALETFTDADVVLATIHEVVGHHHQESRAGVRANTPSQKEACAMRCEASLRSLSGPLVDRWKLMRAVRALIDLRVNHPKALADKPTPEAIYEAYPVRMMDLADVLEAVTHSPGMGMDYFGDDVGTECACK